MLSRFYKNQSKTLLWVVALSFPFLLVQAQLIPANNDIETWLPKDSTVRATYEQFKNDFGVEELVLVGIEPKPGDERLIESVCGRLDRLPGVRKCWSPERLANVMGELGVTREESAKRLHGLATSAHSKLVGLIVLLSDAGLKNRGAAVADIRRELDYCQLRDDEVCLAGAPVVVTELDRVGGQEENQKFFFITLLICLGLLYYWIRDWKTTLSILGLTIWAINLTLTIFALAGGEMNFILGALSVMVMVFTIEAAIHVLHYHKACLSHPDPVGEALRLSWKPCGMSMLTTAIGLFSVSVSDILPVTQFGYAAALGAVVAMLTGLGVTPALLTVIPQSEAKTVAHGNLNLARFGGWLLEHSRLVVVGAAALVLIASFGLLRLQAKIDPIDFLPKHSKVLADVRRVDAELTNTESIEAVVDFGDCELSFVERLHRVRELEALIRSHAAVRHTMSPASFFPEKLPENPLKLLGMLQKAEARKGKNEYLAQDQRLWRISARTKLVPGTSYKQVYEDLERLTAGAPIYYTGIAPLLEQAQHAIFDGFWKSFSSALVVISLVMVASFRSWKTAALAMIPNLAPICFVFGVLGWLRIPVDIGMMMTGSIALGITVDGTFHFLVRYQEQLREGSASSHSVRVALMTTGGPIFESIVVSSIGMLALTLSSFAPTVRFGMLMASLLMVALAGDLILLPALLCLRRDKQVSGSGVEQHAPAPHASAPSRRANLQADRVA